MRFGIVCSLLWACLGFINTALAANTPVVLAQQAINAGFEQPTALAVDKFERMWVVDGGKQRIAVLSAAGQWLFNAGQGPDGVHLPMDIAIAGEQVVVADSGNKRLLQLDLQGKPVQAIRPAIKPQPKREYQTPRPVAVLMQDERLFWSDQANHQLCQQALPLKSGQLAECVGQRGEGDADFQYPFQIASDQAGYVHVVDVINARVKVLHRNGTLVSQISRFGLSADELFRPNGIALDQNDVVYVADNYYGTIAMFQHGRFLGKLQDQQGKTLQFNSPTGLHWHNQQLYVVDSLANTVYRLSLGSEEKTVPAPVAPTAGQLSQKNCLLCHLEWAEAPGAALPKTSVKAVASSKMCYSCHNGVLMDSRLLIQHGGQHPSVDDAPKDKITLKHMQERKDKLPSLFPLTAEREMLCTSCHTPHNDADKHETLHLENRNSWLRVSTHNGDLCERCHESKQKTAREADAKKRGLNHPLAVIFAKAPAKDAPGYVKEEKLAQGLPDSLTQLSASLDQSNKLICQSCHQVHGGVSNELLTTTQENSELCVQCHASKNSKDKKDAHHLGIHPVHEKLEKPIKIADKEVTTVQCASCHKVHAGTLGTPLLPKTQQHSDEICADCHKQQYAKNRDDARHKGVHPVNFTLEEPIKFGDSEVKAITCSTCHAVHGGSPDTAALVNKVKNAEALCVDCHKRQHAQDVDAAKAKGIHPTKGKLEEPVTINKTKIKELGCLSCHSVHHGEQDTPALVQADKNGELCEHCHAQKQAVVGSDHDLRITAKDSKNHYAQTPGEAGVCGSCHSMHQHEGKETTPKLHLDAVKSVLQPADPQRDEVIFKEDALCLNCHQKQGVAKDKPILHFKHPYKDLILRADKKVLPLLDQHEKVHEFGAIACITCHDPHRWQALQKQEIPTWSQNRENKEGTMLNSFLRQKDIKGTFCVECHGIEALPKYKYYHDAKLVRNIGVDYLH